MTDKIDETRYQLIKLIEENPSISRKHQLVRAGGVRRDVMLDGSQVE